jgi:hypothetical protein
MPEKKLTYFQQQKVDKPLVEDVIPVYLDGTMKKSALNLAAWLRANKLKPAWCLTNQWKAMCKGRNICRISMRPWSPGHKHRDWIANAYIVTTYLENLNDYQEAVINEGLQNFLWDNVYYCVNKPADSLPPVELQTHWCKPPCNLWNCAPGKSITVCGKELTNICSCGGRQYFWFHDPDEATLEAIKRLLELEQKARAEKPKTK